jgi:hypothetical protein
MNKCCLLLISFSTVFNAIAAENSTAELLSLKEKVNGAIIKFDQTKQDLWSYEVSRYEDEEGDISSSIVQYSPQASERWILKKINGQQPTSKQVNHFMKKKKEQSNNRKQGKNIDLKLRKLINQESLSLISTDEKEIVMGFNVKLTKLGKNSVGKLQGKLIYQKDKQFIETIYIWNNTEFSPMFTANITELSITFTFSNINGAVLVKQNEMKMKGSFAYFTEINETSVDNFSGYLYQGKKIK